MTPFHTPLQWLKRHFAGKAPALSPAGPADAARFATLHAAAFQRGWSTVEFERLLTERNVVADRAMAGPDLAGFVISRSAADQAEILSIAVAASCRRRGLAANLLEVHLRRLTGYGTASVFLEVDERNVPARRLYKRFGFDEVGRRSSYYVEPGREPGAALILRRDLA